MQEEVGSKGAKALALVRLGVEVVILVLAAQLLAGIALGIIAGIVGRPYGAEPFPFLTALLGAVLLFALVRLQARDHLGADWQGALGLRPSRWSAGRTGLVVLGALLAHWVTVIAVVVAYGALVGLDRAGPNPLGTPPAGALVAIWVANVALIAPAAEELLFRGYL